MKWAYYFYQIYIKRQLTSWLGFKKKNYIYDDFYISSYGCPFTPYQLWFPTFIKCWCHLKEEEANGMSTHTRIRLGIYKDKKRMSIFWLPFVVCLQRAWNASRTLLPFHLFRLYTFLSFSLEYPQLFFLNLLLLFI